MIYIVSILLLLAVVLYLFTRSKKQDQVDKTKELIEEAKADPKVRNVVIGGRRY